MLSKRKTISVLLLIFPFAGLAQEQPEAANTILSRVAEFHGAAGVFAVAGYRIGARALTELQEKRGSFSLDVTHSSGSRRARHAGQRHFHNPGRTG